MGKSYNEIRQLKVEQVSDDYKVIHLEDRDVKCDEYLSYYLKKTIKEDNLNKKECDLGIGCHVTF